MRYRDRKQRDGHMAFNATPLFDMMFTLTIFFMLVCRLSSAEQVRMELPKPEESQAQIAALPERVIINCRLVASGDASSGGEQIVSYSVGPNAPQSLSAIAERLAGMKRKSQEIEAVIRADRRLHYLHVRAAMHVVAENDIRMLNVVAHIGDVE